MNQPRTNSNKKPISPGNIASFFREELEEIAREVGNQTEILGKSLVTELPPSPKGDTSNGVEAREREEEEGRKQRISKTRDLLFGIKERTACSRKVIEQERQEQAQKRDPVVEGIGEKESSGEIAGESVKPLPPPQTTSRPGRGLPMATGEPEKRQKR